MKTEMKNNRETILLAVLFFVSYLVISFFATAGVLWVINWAFSLSFWSWKTSFGIWLALALLSCSVKVKMRGDAD